MTTAATAPAVDRDTFQRLMASFPAGVAVVTTLDRQGKAYGLTTTAVSSVSVAPPLLLVCIDRDSRTLPAIRERGRFAVNFLAADHPAVAQRFASKADDKFAALAWTAGADGMPILHDHSVAWAECRTRQEIEAGDHLVLIAEVTNASITEDAAATLVYARRRFGRWSALDNGSRTINTWATSARDDTGGEA
jgi:flavin reductase (DIM6/NTAB) family NADH-FMN oxidoreductase RutF